MTLAGLLAPLSSPRILDAVCPPEEERFDVADFLAGRNTLYLLTGKGNATVAPLITMLTDHLVRSAQNISQTRPGSGYGPRCVSSWTRPRTWPRSRRCRR